MLPSLLRSQVPLLFTTAPASMGNAAPSVYVTVCPVGLFSVRACSASNVPVTFIPPLMFTTALVPAGHPPFEYTVQIHPSNHVSNPAKFNVAGPYTTPAVIEIGPVIVSVPVLAKYITPPSNRIPALFVLLFVIPVPNVHTPDGNCRLPPVFTVHDPVHGVLHPDPPRISNVADTVTAPVLLKIASM